MVEATITTKKKVRNARSPWETESEREACFGFRKNFRCSFWNFSNLGKFWKITMKQHEVSHTTCCCLVALTMSTDDPIPPLEEQTKRPIDTALRQQRVRAWYPILDPWWVIGAFVILGAVFVPVGTLPIFAVPKKSLFTRRHLTFCRF
jgi:hypothetical protein